MLKDCVVHLDDADALLEPARLSARRCLARHLAQSSGTTIVSGLNAWEPIEGTPCALVPVRFELPEAGQRTALWAHALRERGVTTRDTAATRKLGERFQLDRSQIDAAVAAAVFAARARSGAALPVLDELFAAARAQTRHALAHLAVRLESSRTWSDLVLAEDAMAQMREICACAVHRQRVMEEWGFAEKLSYGKGINVLFSGPSGTGKTMAAQILANELKLDLYRIDLASVVSKYIGETEKNLDRIFGAAGGSNAILFFDEADALFGKRTEVKDSHDRYANIEVSYLLQKLEEYEGITILATNMRQNLDEAFVRRLAFIVHFPFPDEALRRRIWATVWPAEVPLAREVDLDFFARQFKLSGGSIRNVALAATFLAAGDSQVVTREHLLRAVQREFSKVGKSIAATADGPAGDRHE